MDSPFSETLRSDLCRYRSKAFGLPLVRIPIFKKIPSMASSSKSSSANRAVPFPLELEEEKLGPNRLRVNMWEQSPYPYPKDVKVQELVPKMLRVKNYLEWKRQMLDDVITSNGMLGFIDGAVEAPPETVIISDGTNGGGGTSPMEITNKEYVAWKRSDDLVRDWILSRLTSGLKKKVSLSKTAKGVWEALPPLVEESNKRLSHYLPLYKAAIQGDWDKAEAFIKTEPHAVRARITHDSETALIIAVKVKRRNEFVENLVEKMSEADLALVDDGGRTALHRAAGAGNIKAAEILVKKNPGLINKETRYNHTPLFYATARGDQEMILWLMKRMGNKRLEGDPGFRILYELTRSQLYDIALTVLQNNPELAYFIPKKEEDLKFHALTALAEQPSSFESGNTFNFLQELIYFIMKILPKKDEGMESENIADFRSRGDIEAPPTCNNFGATNGGWGYAVKKRLHAMVSKVIETFDQLLIKPIREIREKKLRQDQALDLFRFLCNEVITKDFSNADRIFRLPLEQATMMGIPEIVEEILVLYPYAVSLENHKKQTVFQQAIVFRQEKVFNLIHQHEESRVIVLSKWDDCGNNALHLAGYEAHPEQLYRRAGAALQMQRELQWFKEVERLVLPKNREERNKDKRTPKQVFSDTHKELVKEGERWMKDTASSCTIIASLIATVVFAAAITVPGGNNDNGHPIFDQQTAFIIFGIFNALSLFSSLASVILFLSILTSRYAEEDFLVTLPRRLIIGLICLFLSILFTMMAFGATLYLVFGENRGWILVLVVFGGLPVTLFFTLQFPLMKDMIKSTCGSGIFVKQSDRMLQ
ncbi:hypothetical protein Vadar_030322 [Vaccinium darrowii]|uniref:Uncharacterized protein n=1 Tax=Vaccinium darrowii TaxID=229202 RepID=A0ACB7Y2M7_9ERIC|nr:hypothetical protein Vadar_030322 [Vaccinium darrowii]